jgi:chaperonin GroES
MKFRPLSDRVVVEVLESAQKVGSIILPDTVQEKPQEGKIVAAGPGGRSKKGALEALDVKVGDRVVYGKWSGTEIKIDDKSYLVMRESDILGVVDGAGSVSVRDRDAVSAATETAAASTAHAHVHTDDCCH